MKLEYYNSILSYFKSNMWLNNLARRTPLFYRKYFNLFDALNTYDLNQRKDWTNKRLELILKEANKTSYGKREGGGSIIEDWPILKKNSLKNDLDSFLNNRKLFSVTSSTSGSTGEPLKLYRTPLSILIEQVCIDRLFLIKGLEPKTTRTAIIRGDSIKSASDMTPPFWKEVNVAKVLFSSHHIKYDTIKDYYQQLLKFSPECIMAYPSSLESLCNHLKSINKKLEVPLVITSSEKLSESTVEIAKNILNCDVVDHYGLGERVAFSFGINAINNYFIPGYGYIELQYVKTIENEDIYKIIATSLWNKVMPLIRYETGDLLRVESGSTKDQIEEIRYGLRSFIGIYGRESDYIISPDGARIIGMNHIPRDVENIMQMQIIQEEKNKVRILVVPTEEYCEKDKKKILNNAYEKIPDTMHIQIEKVDMLVRTSMGKTPFIIRQIQDSH